MKPKKVSYRLIASTSDEGRPIYALLEELVEAHHRDLWGARIALAWCSSWKPDVDGHVTLGKCKKASDLDRELAAYDFIILLREAFWTDPQVNELQRRALLDHELCHAAVACDRTGAPVEDDRGRPVYRTRKHDLEEFSQIAARYGCWKRDLEQFARALDHARGQASTWVGYTALQADLQQVGVWLPLETITAWTDAERREARTWALLQQEAPEGVNLTLSGCVAQALAAESDSSPAADARLPIGDR